MKTCLTLCWLVFIATVASSGKEDEVLFSNSWAVEVKGGPRAAEALASKHGCLYKGQVFDDYYHFVHYTSPLQTRRKRDLLHPLHHILKAEKQVGYVEQQVIRHRYKRSHFFIYSPPSSPSWNKQWYLHRDNHHDMNVQRAWEQNVTGNGIVVSILDDGLEHTHPDLQANYDPLASYDFNDYDSDPFPRYDPTNENKHGTRCAGEVASSKGSRCGVGAAFGAKVGGIRMLDTDQVTDLIEASSLSYKPQHVHIYSSSWGPNDDGSTVDGPGPLAIKAFENGVRYGRGGLGSVFVWAAGNGGRKGDSCNCDGYAVSPLTISVSSASETDYKPWYLEQCSSTLTSTYSSGGIHEKQIVTTDLHHRCTSSHTGTSASAPLGAAMIALALEVNQNLTWRDVQYLAVLSSNPQYPHDDHWHTNGAGLRVSHWYGFGILDGASLVNRARHWTPVPEYTNCSFNVTTGSKVATNSAPLSVVIPVESCGIVYIEHVQVITTIHINHGMRKDISVFLTSPAGTKSTLLPFRSYDRHTDGFHLWPFMTVHSWGEQSRGDWVFDVKVKSGTSVRLDYLQLIVFGTQTIPASVESIPSKCHPQCVGGCAKEGPEYCDTCKHYRVAHTSECVETCPSGTYLNYNMCRSCSDWCAECTDGHSCARCQTRAFQLPDGSCSDQCPKEMYSSKNGSCIPCHPSCLSCNGPLQDDCTECHPQFVLQGQSCVMREPTSCSMRQYFDHRAHECRSCHSLCASCTGKGSTECITCPEGIILDGENRCVDNNTQRQPRRSCNPGQYFDESSLQCNACPSSCSNCSDNFTCTACPEGFSLSQDGLCAAVESCPQGTFRNKELCVPCMLHCHKCLSLDSCTECDSGFYRLRSDAVEQCASCQSPCTTCAGSARNCSSCLSGMAWEPISSRCVTCCTPDEITVDCCNCDLDSRTCHLSASATEFAELPSLSASVATELPSSSSELKSPQSSPLMTTSFSFDSLSASTTTAVPVKTIVGVVFFMFLLTCLVLVVFLWARIRLSKRGPSYHKIPKVDHPDTEIYSVVPLQ